MYKISIVIATLGGIQLSKTVKLLNEGSLIPDEILICVPIGTHIKNLNYDNVRIIPTMIKGQVAQRIEGFKKVKNEFVLQIDDDILVENNFLKDLLHIFLKLPDNSSFSPSFKFIENNMSIYSSYTGFLNTLYYFLINGTCGYKQGVITKAGTEIGVYSFDDSNSTLEVEWLPGGCILHRKKNLVLHNYFPYHGKAYCEDLFHSCELKKRGINLYITGIVHAYITDPRTEVFKIRNQFSSLKNDFKMRSKFCKNYYRKTNINFFIYYFIRINSIIYKTLFWSKN